MANPTDVLRGTVHGNTIEFPGELGLPDGQEVTVTVLPPPVNGPSPLRSQGEGTRSSSDSGAEHNGAGAAPLRDEPEPLPTVELWADRLVFDPSIRPDERIVRGTGLAAEALVAEFEQGRGDEDMIRAHPELSIEDLKALRAYARVPGGLRRSFGAWADDGDELDRYIESVYESRRAIQRRPVE